MSRPDDKCTRCGGAGHKLSECSWPACVDCATAIQRLWHGFQAACKGCEARVLAMGLLYAGAQEVKRMTPSYTAALKSIFGDEWMTGHEQVKGWAKRLEARC